MFDQLKIMVKISEDLRFFFVDENGEDDDNTQMLLVFKRKFHVKENDNITTKYNFDNFSISIPSH